ncbi:MAG: polyphosphate kinase 1 [Bdellovibrionota bacterium]
MPTLGSLLTARHAPYIHRDLSWLQFNERVLAEARQNMNPLLERTKFLAISASNLDEFFMIRVASLGRSIHAQGRHGRITAEGKRLLRIRSSILEAVTKFGAKQAEALDLLVPELAATGIHVLRHLKPDDAFYALAKQVFEAEIFPRLEAADHFKFSKISSLENLQSAVIFREKAWFRIPKNIPGIFVASTESKAEACVFFLDDLLLTFLGAAFSLEGPCGILRMTRDADITVDLEIEDPESIPDAIRTGIGVREKGRPIRVQYLGDFPAQFLDSLAASLRIRPDQIFLAPYTLHLQSLGSIANQLPENTLLKPGVKHPSLRSMIPTPFRSLGQHCFDSLKERDCLLHHPYDSFDAYVTWIRAACADPSVTSIEQTVYRTDTISPVIDALKEASARKRIRVVIELRARFDELNNLRLADELRKAGVEVGFGFGRLKLHAKVALVTRKENGVDRLYTHLSTGNYNASTARQYTDLAIITANEEVGQDARLFFDAVWKGEVPSHFRWLVTAPTKLHRRLLSHIAAETAAALRGQRARIVAKVNALVDQKVIESLYQASQAGVQIDLIVRGACSLIPGVKGLSENIRVISVVDRFLEHSRIYYFEHSKAMYLSSADWMPRNFFSRLEIAFPVLDEKVYRYIEQVILPAYLSDTVKAKELTPQGTWKKRSARPGQTAVRSQFLLEELAVREYKGTPLG